MTSPSTFGYSGKVLLVTGGAMGIGAGIVEVLAEAGATVVIADLENIGCRWWLVGDLRR